MSITQQSPGAAAVARPTPRLSSGLSRLAEEAGALLSALMSPSSVIKEVEVMSALHRRAAAVEARDPALAAQLRREAARIGLR